MGRSRPRFLVAVVLFASAAVGNVAAQIQQHGVEIHSPDGTALKASYFSPGRPGPGVLLLHQCNRNRHAWDELAADLAQAGMHVLAFDYRGFGETKGTLPQPPPAPKADTRTKFGPTISAAWIGNKDVELAYVYLRSLPGVNAKRVGVGGASCGAGFAADLTIRHPEIRALFVLSGQVSGGAAAHFAATSWLPVFGAADRGDMPIAFESMQAAIALSKNPRSMMKMYDGNSHGVEMFDRHPQLAKQLAGWLARALQ